MSGISHMLLGPLKGVKDVLFNVTGIGASGGVGSLFVGTVTEVNPVGVQALAQLGSANSTVSAGASVTGVTATGQVSAVNASAVLEVPVTGVQASTQVSPVTTTTISNVSVTLTGVAGSAQTGSSSIIIESGAFPLPANAVLIWDKTDAGASVPAGFTEIDLGATDYLIQGSTIANANTTTSTTGTLSGTGASSTAGAHSTPWNPIGAGKWDNNLSPNTPESRFLAFTGGHSHSVSISPKTIPTDTLPEGMGIKLITNASEVSEIPQDAVMFCDSSRSGFIRKTWSLSYGAYIGQRNTYTTVGSRSATALSFSLTSTSSGTHRHTSPGTAKTAPSPSPFPVNSAVAPGIEHTHPVSTPSLNLYLYQYYKHLLPFIATTDSAVRSGMIVMFKGASVPSGWSLCDGTGGTPDMTSYFLGYNNDETSTDVVVGSRSAKNSATAPPTTGNTSSTYTPTGIPVTFNTITWSHNHTGPTSSFNSLYTTPTVSYHSTKSVPHGHTVPSVPLTVPSSFLPNTFRLAFIRKD